MCRLLISFFFFLSFQGRKFWKICFVQNDQLQEDVPWVTFLEKFCMYFTLDGRAYMPATADYKCMRELFSVNDTVNLRNFGRRLGFFGPLEKGKWMEDVKVRRKRFPCV